MGATIQSKTYFSGSITDLNNSFHNGVWNLFNDDKSQKISSTGNSQRYDYFLTKNATDGCTGYAKEQIRQTILKHETIFKHQLQELHRLYKRQRDLMNLVPVETSNFGHFLSHVPSDVSQETHMFASSFPLVDSPFSRACVKGKTTLKDFGAINLKCGVFERRVIDLELPVDVAESNAGKLFNQADLNERIQAEERETAFSAFFSNRNRTNCPAEEPQKPDFSAKRRIFGVEIDQKNHTLFHHINLDSLQNHSQHFFNKNNMAESNDTRECKKVKIDDDTQSITKILGVPIFNPKFENHCESNGKKCHIDLNLCLDEEDDSPSLPESVVKIATMEIDLEVPAVLESDSDDGSMDTNTELVNVAAEAIVSFVSISLSQPPPVPSADTLLWFAEVIMSNVFKKKDNSVPENMDYFEYMTLQLEDTAENYDIHKPMVVEDQKEEESGSLLKRTARKGQGKRGRQKKDFQKDILPSIVSLSRREATEDLQIFEEALSATGVTWQSSFLKRKAAARNGRGNRRLVAPQPVEVAGEPSICRELSLEKSLGGWGRRTRRLPRQRCQNGGSHRSLALKC